MDFCGNFCCLSVEVCLFLTDQDFVLRVEEIHIFTAFELHVALVLRSLFSVNWVDGFLVLTHHFSKVALECFLLVKLSLFLFLFGLFLSKKLLSLLL